MLRMRTGKQVTLVVPPPALLITAHPLNPPELQFRQYRTRAMILAYHNALAAGDTDVDVAAWAFSLLGHKIDSHTVKSDKLSFLLTIPHG